MNDDKSPVDRLNDELNSRTGYTAPADTRSPVHTGEPIETKEKWDSPELDAMIEAHQEPDNESSKMKKFFLLSVLAFIGAFVIAAYVYFGGGNFISTKNVDIQVTGPAVIEAGQPLSLAVTVDNQNNAELDGVVLSIQYPDGTRQADDETLALAHDEVDIGQMKAGGESTQTFRSALFGQKGDVLTLKLSLEYKVQGSSATFYKDKTFDVTIGDAPIVMSIDHSSSITSGEAYDTMITIASNSSDVIKDVVVRAEYPYGYSLASSDPATSTGNNFWRLGDLAPGDKKVITLHGSISGVDDEERTFRYYAGIADPGRANTLKSALISTTDTVHIARPAAGLSISLNGDTEGDYIAPAGSSVNAAIRYENNSPDKLVNARLSVRITGAALDKTSIKPSEGGFYDSNTGLVVWQSPGVSDLLAVAPGESGNVSVTFASLATIPTGKSQALSITATITGQPDGIASAEPVTNSATRLVKISSTVNFSGKALYSRGPFHNIGPLPPKAEATTTYTVVLDLGNTQNDVAGGKVTATLGPNVSFLSGGTGSDAVSYDESSRTVTWNVGTLDSGAGFSKPLRETAFQVSLIPSIGQIGTVPALVSGISFSGTDSFTNLPVAATLPSITTRLTSDAAFIQGDDVVVK